MLKRLRNKIERKVASKQPVRFRYELVVNNLEGLVMDTKEVEICVSWSRGGKRKKSTSWRLVYPGESCAYFDESLAQAGITLYRDKNPPYTFEEKEYEIKVHAKYVELGQVVSQVIGSTVIDLSKYASSESNASKNETFKVPLKYRGFTNNVASLKVIVKSSWLKDLKGADLDQLSEVLTNASVSSSSNYNTAMSHMPLQEDREQAKSPTSVASSTGRQPDSHNKQKDSNPFSSSSYRDGKSIDDVKHVQDEARLQEDKENMRELVKRCESAMDALQEDFAKLNFEVDGKIDDIFLAADATEKKVQGMRKKLGNVHALKSQMKLLEDSKDARESKMKQELEKANGQIEFLKQEALISETRVGNLKRALQEKDIELEKQKEEVKSAQESRSSAAAEEEVAAKSPGADEGNKRVEEWSMKVNTLVLQVQTLQADLDEANMKLAQGPTSAPRGNDDSAENLILRVKELEMDLSRKEDELSQKTEEAEDYELTIGSLKAQLKSAQQGETDSSDKKLENLQEEVASLQGQLDEMKDANTRLEQTAATVPMLQQRETDLMGQVDSLNADMETMRASASNAEGLQSTISNLEQQLALKATALENAQSSLKELSEKAETDTSNAGRLEGELVSLQGQLDEMKDANTRLEAAAAEASSQRDEAQAQVSALQQREADLVGKVNVLTADTKTMQAASSDAEGLQSTVANLEQQLEIKVTELECAQSSMKELSAKAETHASSAERLVGELVTLQEQLDEMKVANTRLEETAARVPMLQQSETELVAQVNSLNANIETMRASSSDTEALQSTISNLEQQLEMKGTELENAQSSMKELSAKAETHASSSGRLVGELASLQEQLDEMKIANTRLEEAAAAVPMLQQREADLAAQVNSLNADMETMRASSSGASPDAEGLQSTIAHLEHQLETKATELENAQSSMKELSEQAQTYLASIQQYDAQLNEMQANFESEQKLTGGLQQSVNQLEEEVQLKSQQAETSNLNLATLTAEIATLRERKESAEADMMKSREDKNWQNDLVAELQRSLESEKELTADLQRCMSELKEEGSKKSESLEETLLKVGALTATVEALTRERDEAKSYQLPEEEKSNSSEEVLKTRIGELESELQFLRLASQEPAETAGATKKVEDMQGQLNGRIAFEQEICKEIDRLAAFVSDNKAPEDLSENYGEEPLSDYLSKLIKSMQLAFSSQEAAKEKAEENADENAYPNIQISEEKAGPQKDVNEMLADLVRQKTALQEENSFLIGELTEAKIELAEIKMSRS